MQTIPVMIASADEGIITMVSVTQRWTQMADDALIQVKQSRCAWAGLRHAGWILSASAGAPDDYRPSRTILLLRRRDCYRNVLPFGERPSEHAGQRTSRGLR
ncbi:MAG: hypothetical protein ABS58_03665 [Mesorhizobium sp. SCN 65-20]|nr:MAG: hypothetical protein ABS58_03665 [Mesorhizobium sp. SCN 65-20]